MAAPALEGRRILLAYSHDARDAARTLRWALAHVVREADRVSLVHVRAVSVLAPATTPVVEVGVPVAQLPAAWAPPGDADVSDVADALKTLQQRAAVVDAVELRTVLRVADALLTYLRFLPQPEKADALVMGSHGARGVGTAIWKVPHASLDVAAGNTVCALFLVRGEAAAAPPPAGAGRFLALALDGAAPSSELLTRWTISNVLRPNDTLTIINKNPGSDASIDAEVKRCAELVAEYQSRAGGAGKGGAVTVRRLGPHSDVRDALVDITETGLDAAQGPPALLVLGSRGAAARSLKRLVLGSTADYVVRAAAAPLCIVPPLEEAVGPTP